MGFASVPDEGPAQEPLDMYDIVQDIMNTLYDNHESEYLYTDMHRVLWPGLHGFNMEVRRQPDGESTTISVIVSGG
jgi:hypothetical protein